MIQSSLLTILLAPMLLGVALLLFSWEKSMRRMAVLFVSGLVLLLGLVLVSQLEWSTPENALNSGDFRFVWSTLWSSDFVLNLSTTSAPFVLMSALAFLVSYICQIGSEGELEEERMSALLILQGVVNGVYLSDSLFAYVFFTAMTALPTVFLLGFDPVLRERLGIHKYLSIEVVATILGLVAVVGLKSYNSADVPSWLSLQSGDYELGSRAILFACLSLSLLLRSSIYPFYLTKLDWSEAKPLAAMLPLLVVVAPMGLYGFFAFAIKEYAMEWRAHGWIFVGLGLLSVLWASFRLFLSSSHRANLLFLTALFQGAALLGLACERKLGITGAWLSVCFSQLAVLAYGILLVYGERRGVDPAPNYSTDNPYAGFAYALCLLCAFGFPLSFGFYAMAFVVWGVAQYNLLVFGLVLLSVPLIFGTTIKNLLPTSAGSEGGWSSHSWTRSEIGLLLPFLAILLFCGVFSNWVVGLVSPTAEYFFALLRRG